MSIFTTFVHRNSLQSQKGSWWQSMLSLSERVSSEQSECRMAAGDLQRHF